MLPIFHIKFSTIKRQRWQFPRDMSVFLLPCIKVREKGLLFFDESAVERSDRVRASDVKRGELPVEQAASSRSGSPRFNMRCLEMPRKTFVIGP